MLTRFPNFQQLKPNWPDQRSDFQNSEALLPSFLLQGGLTWLSFWLVHCMLNGGYNWVPFQNLRLMQINYNHTMI